MMIPAATRGTKRYCTGSVARACSASSCSVTRIVPISAAIDEPARPVTISPTSTGESSRSMARATTLATKFSACTR
jgi:hypothetical protein